MSGGGMHRGIVKQVLSGDSIVVRGKPVNGPPPERQLALAHVAAPRLGRKDVPDEPFAWASREHLRRLLVGKEVGFRVEYSSQSGREYGSVYLSPGEESNVIPQLVSAGWVKVQEGGAKEKDKGRLDLEELRHLEANAQHQGLGIWAKGNPASRVRDVKYTLDDPKALLDKSKGKTLKAVVERVRDGSTLQLLLVPSFQYVTVVLTGVKAPIYRKDVPDQPDLIEPFAAEAKFYTESRLLNQEVEVVLEGVNNKVLAGTVTLNKTNIAEGLLREGFAKIAEWSVSLVSSGSLPLREAEKSAKQKRLRMWKNYVEKAAPKTEPVFSGKVVKILAADSLLIQGETERKIYFSSFRQPKLKDPKEGYYHMQAKEHLRKTLIGKKVEVKVDYIKPAEGEFEEKTCATVKLGDTNIALELISLGLGFAMRHKQDDTNRSPHLDDFKAKEAEATSAKKGVHNPASVPAFTVDELSDNPSKAKQLFPRLHRLGRLAVVVEHVFNGSRFKVWSPAEKFRATLILSGVNCGRVGQGSSDHFATEAFNYATKTCLQQDAEIEIEAIDKNGAFVGSLFINNQNLALYLLEHGLGASHGSAESSPYVNSYLAAEARAKAQKKNIWSKVQDKPAEAQSEEVEAKKERAEGVVTEVNVEGDFYVQLVGKGVAQFEQLMVRFREAMGAASEPLATPKVGSLCSARFSFDNQWYRARILSAASKGSYLVQYIDYGNTEVLPTSKMAPLSSEFSSLPPQATLCSLVGITYPKDEDDSNEARAALSDMIAGKRLKMELLGKNDKGPQVVLFEGGEDYKSSINYKLVAEGLVLVEKRKDKRFAPLIEALMPAQEDAKAHRRMIWRHGDVTEDEEDTFRPPRR